jgi:hypothetical protein
MSTHDIQPVCITSFPLGMYESYSARITRDGDFLSVERCGLDGITVLTHKMRGASRAVTIELSDDELEALATMLREAYESQAREA